MVILFLGLEGSRLLKDLTDARVQITDLGSPTVYPQDLVAVSGDTISLISGFNKKTGLPYYNYGDFYSRKRALRYNNDTPSNWLWAMAFELGNGKEQVRIKAEARAKLPHPDDPRAELTIQPYLNQITTDSVTVLWETDSESHSIVHYGSKPSLLDQAVGKSSRYQDPGLSGITNPPVFNLSVHQVELTGLEPGSTYYYQIRSSHHPSPVDSFRTLSREPKTFAFAIIGDTQTDPDHQRVIDQMAGKDFDFYFHLGDFANDFSGALRRNFFQIEQPLLSRTPIFPVRGNHESALWYRAYYALPKNNYSPDLNELCYSFSYQGVYFIVIEDLENQLAEGSAVYYWLERELAKAYSDPDRKFTFIFSHPPFYSGYDHSYGPGVAGLSFLAPLFRQYDVSAGFAGHNHLYERLDVSGVPYITSGGGGGSFFSAGDAPDPSFLQEESQSSGEQVQSLVQEWRYHFLLVEVGADYFQVSAYDDQGTLFDQVMVSK